MFTWPRDKTDLQKLQKRYCRLMKSAYNLALKDKQKSDSLHIEANEILTEIKKIEHHS